MPPIYPFWFKQRQCKAEPAGDDNTLKVSGPNLGEAFIGIAQVENKQWRAFLRASASGPDTSATEPEFTNPTDAWEAAFELFRTSTIV
ncbi:MAG TPA: hypothetical protein VMF69_27690 [Gemmataceae bacterium]|nr:hypothetical protein [Gemmataceae bacterium]